MEWTAREMKSPHHSSCCWPNNHPSVPVDAQIQLRSDCRKSQNNAINQLHFVNQRSRIGDSLFWHTLTLCLGPTILINGPTAGAHIRSLLWEHSGYVKIDQILGAKHQVHPLRTQFTTLADDHCCLHLLARASLPPPALPQNYYTTRQSNLDHHRLGTLFAL